MIGAFGMNITTPEFRALVAIDQPEGCTCGYCGQPNDFWDDCGWFYFSDYRGIPATREARVSIESKSGCKSCYYGPIGQSHVDWHGIGER